MAARGRGALAVRTAIPADLRRGVATARPRRTTGATPRGGRRPRPRSPRPVHGRRRGDAAPGPAGHPRAADGEQATPAGRRRVAARPHGRPTPTAPRPHGPARDAR